MKHSENRMFMPSRPTAPVTPIQLPQILPIIMQNNIALAQKPASLPPPPQIVTPLNSIPLGLQFSFNQLTLPAGYTNVIDSYRIYRNVLANEFSGAFMVRTLKHDPTNQGSIIFQDLTGSGQTYYYFITAVDTRGQESNPNRAQSVPVTSGLP